MRHDPVALARADERARMMDTLRSMMERHAAREAHARAAARTVFQQGLSSRVRLAANKQHAPTVEQPVVVTQHRQWGAKKAVMTKQQNRLAAKYNVDPAALRVRMDQVKQALRSQGFDV